MERIDVFSVVAGIVMALAGLVLFIASFFDSPFLIIPALFLLITGIVILLTLRQQEYVEPIREKNKSRGRRKR